MMLRRDTREDPSFRPGDIYSFHTAPVPPGIARETSRYAAIKVLDVKNGEIFYTVLDGVFDVPPSLADVAGRPPLVNTRLGFDGKPVCYVNRITDENGLCEFRHVGVVPLTDEERAVRRQVPAQWVKLPGDGRHSTGFRDVGPTDRSKHLKRSSPPARSAFI